MKRLAFAVFVAVLTAFLLHGHNAVVPSTASAQVIATADLFAAMCPSKTTVDGIKADFPAGINFDVDPSAGQGGGCLADDTHYALTRLQRKVYNSLYIMKYYLVFDAPLPWTSETLWNWFKGSVKGISFTNDSYSYCCDSSLRIHIASGPNMIVLSPWGDQFMDPQWNLGLHNFIDLLVHEARHANGPGHNCESGSNDQTIAELGSWGAQRFFEAWWADLITNRGFWTPDNPAQRSSRYLDTIREDGEGLASPDGGRFCNDAYVQRPVPLVGDYDGDGRADAAVYRYSNSTWYMNESTAGVRYKQWGGIADIPVAADFDGDGKTDPAVFRVPTGTWYYLRSNTSYAYYTPVVWGTKGDIPVPADYNGDGSDDVAVWRPSSGTWFVKLGGSYSMTQWGRGSGNGYLADVPVPADYDGDGKADIAVYRPDEGRWYIKPSNGSAVIIRQWGTWSDVPVPADYNFDQRAELAVWRPSTGTWFLLPLNGGAYTSIQWGTWNDKPATGDFDHDGISDIAVFRPSNGTWYVKKSSGGYTVTQWGRSGDTPQ